MTKDTTDDLPSVDQAKEFYAKYDPKDILGNHARAAPVEAEIDRVSKGQGFVFGSLFNNLLPVRSAEVFAVINERRMFCDV
ncbi:hypothetical protein RRG08_013801 [Elysia crispata]|uniref:Uncharacterized protein n=1 Tax=Elysia crispata TaxID=231223 RepID=A0AAE1EEU7_9GAST|nr:hypothetical protein RRG08_013801 [Elysia crispata]